MQVRTCNLLNYYSYDMARKVTVEQEYVKINTFLCRWILLPPPPPYPLALMIANTDKPLPASRLPCPFFHHYLHHLYQIFLAVCVLTPTASPSPVYFPISIYVS